MKKYCCLFLTLLLGISIFGCKGSQGEAIPVQISYETAIVSYLGPEGTYTQEACGTFFEKQGSSRRKAGHK